MQIDLKHINRDDFYVQTTPHGTLIAPRKSKHAWSDEELHLRSLLVGPDGEIVSSGFPKFFNYGERPEIDKALERAVARGEVEFVEKRDGSLLIGDRIDGRAHWRTRGSAGLGEFESHVMEALAAHMKLASFIERAPYEWVKEHSFLFEYTGPKNRIILPYESSGVHFLALVHKPTMEIIWQGDKIDQLCQETGVPKPEVYALPAPWAETKAAVAGWKGLEGVVARFSDERGQRRLVKIKSLEYLMRHALRYRLTGRRAVQFALMLGAQTVEDLKPLFEELAMDWEAIEYVRPEVENFLDARRRGERKMDIFKSVVGQWKKETGTDRKRFVEKVIEATDGKSQGEFAGRSWFNRAMLLYSGRVAEADINMLAEVAGEPAGMVKTWLAEGRKGVLKVLSGWGKEEDGVVAVDKAESVGSKKR